MLARQAAAAAASATRARAVPLHARLLTRVSSAHATATTTTASASVASTSTSASSASSRAPLYWTATGASLLIAVVSFTTSASATHRPLLADAAPSSSPSSSSSPSPASSLSVLKTAVGETRLADFLTTADVRLYQYQTCPFCNKVRAYLDFAGIPYTIIEVNPLTKSEIAFSSDYKKVPIVIINGQRLVDSTDIITKLDAMLNEYRVRPRQVTEDETRQRRWVDEKLVFLTAPNLYRTWTESVESFDYIMQQSEFSSVARYLNSYVGAVSMFALTHMFINKKRNITDARGQLYAACREWAQDLEQRGVPFSGGHEPNLADVSAYGVWRALLGFGAGRDMMQRENTGDAWLAWFARMHRAVGSSMAKPRADGRAVAATVGRYAADWKPEEPEAPAPAQPRA